MRVYVFAVYGCGLPLGRPEGGRYGTANTVVVCIVDGLHYMDWVPRSEGPHYAYQGSPGVRQNGNKTGRYGSGVTHPVVPPF